MPLANRSLPLSCLLLVFAASCSDGNTDPVSDGGADAFADVDDVGGEDTDLDVGDDDVAAADFDVTDTGDDDIVEADTDTDTDAQDTAVEPVPVPFVPEPVATPVVDEPFVQEWNHTTPEVDTRIGALVDVVLPPSGFDDWVSPLQVTPRGLLRGTSEDALDLIELADELSSDLVGAGSVPGLIVAASEDVVYRVSADGTFTTEAALGVSIERVVQGLSGVWLLTDLGVALVTAEDIDWDDNGPRVLALAEDTDGVVAAWEGTLGRWADGTSIGEGLPVWELVNAEDPGYEAIVLDVTLPESLDVVALHADGILGVREDGASADLVAVELFAHDSVPLRGAVEAVRTGDGGFVAVGPEGAWRIMDRGDGPEWRVYPAERWLPNEDTRGVATAAVDELSSVHFATAGGYAWVSAEYMTLEEKMAYFQDRVVDRHDRDGAVADSHLPVRGDLSSSIPWDSDNDGGWTCYWILSECSRWLETGAQDARANFDRSLARMLSFQTLTGTNHFLARAVIRREGCMLDDCDDPDDGEWFLSPDEEWWVKGDTSNDEVISHMFMMGPAYDWCATDEQRAGIEQHVTRIVGGLIDNEWKLLDIDGEMTRYGQFQPEYVNGVGLVSDGGRRSVAVLGMTALAHHVSGEQRFVDARQELMDEHGYHDNAVRESEYPLRWGQYSGDNNELAMQAWMALVRYETDPVLRDMWLDGWSRTYSGIVEQEGAFWDMANHMLGGEETQLAHLVRWLRLAPIDYIRWNIHNTHRRDLIAPPSNYEQDGRQRSDGRPIPLDERSIDRWNTDQYRVDRGFNGRVEMDGADATAPYWLARHYGLIVPVEE